MPPPPSAKALSLARSAQALCVPLGDAGCCNSIVMQDMQQLDDCVEFLVLGHKVKGDAAVTRGPPRLMYEAPGKLAATGGRPSSRVKRESEGGGAAAASGICSVNSKQGVSFDWLVALGCLNCGAPVELRRDLVAAAESAVAAAAAAAAAAKDSGAAGAAAGASPAAAAAAAAAAAEKAVLRCRRCGHDIAPLHSSEESECLVERMESGAHRKAGLASGGVYMYGTRSSCCFGLVGKQQWQQRFLGSDFEKQQLQHHLKIMLAAGEGGKKTTCKELCEKCGNTEAFFSTFQARSADEGMTVMYECTKCHHRKVFNN
ncbi:RNA polymerase, putative [Eimeria brunetti]|uniref:RNA polymerase, putative n=1 Tax=Eimeria brunetti TaxID=51314 RepID=U6LKD1_9EIME|nr:RNA polymerase, putative [Eimeria brunetti]